MHCKSKSCSNLTLEGKISALNALHNTEKYSSFCKNYPLVGFFFWGGGTFYDVCNVFINLILCYHV